MSDANLTISSHECGSSHTSFQLGSFIQAGVVLIYQDQEAPYRNIIYDLPKISLDPSLPAEGIKEALLSEDPIFEILGEVVSINKKDKKIVLTNHDTVAYHHCLLISSDIFPAHDQKKPFEAALQALADGLIIKDILSLSINSQSEQQKPDFNSHQLSLSDKYQPAIYGVVQEMLQQANTPYKSHTPTGGTVVLC